jgi:acetyl esterase/lipase
MPPQAHRRWGVLQANRFHLRADRDPRCVRRTREHQRRLPLSERLHAEPDPSANLPIIVWIHGGGNVDGESNDYDGSKLAGLGNTVVVTINYRLNLMGFFAHPALDTSLWQLRHPRSAVCAQMG